MENFTCKRETFPTNRMIRLECRNSVFNRKIRKFRRNPTSRPVIKQVLIEVVIYHADKITKLETSHGILWSYSGGNTNQLVHAIAGNKRIGYNAAVWNCRRGLINPDGAPGLKMTDIQLYLQRHQLDLFGIVESDLHGTTSRIYRAKPLSTSEIHQKLHIAGYNIILPQSWYDHGQARVILFAKDGIQIKERKLRKEDSDLPSISIELGLGREKKTCFNIFYREFTGGISGLKDTNSQKQRLERQISHWKTLYAGGKDVVILGDSNLCSKQWMSSSYQHKDQASMVKDFLLEQGSQQLVTEVTRSELVAGVVQMSIIDHCYSDVSEKISGPFVEPVGDSDHLGVRITKYCRYPAARPQVIKKRVFKNFCIEGFLNDIFHSNINNHVTSHDTIEGAAEAFRNEFSAILDFHAPVKTIQIREKYCPFLTEETKQMINERNVLLKEASKTGDKILLREAKIRAKEVKKAVENDKKLGLMRDLGDYSSSKLAWKAARKVLGITKNLAPTAIKKDDGEVIRNPEKIANHMNSYFIEKVKKLRSKTNTPPTIDPILRLDQWLNKRAGPLPPFKIKEISRKQLRTLIKKMKGGRSCGVDNVDSFSLKIAAPLIEDALLHIVNLSIRTSIFSNFWKHQLIFPQHKKQDKLLDKNYRPVSHLVEIGLMVENAVCFQVVDHFTTNSLFHRNHHGGLANHSTATALIQLHDMFLEAAENKKLSAVLLLDQSAAYDLLDHKILLKKLARYNFDENSINWFGSYLSKRSQSVQIEAKQSSTEDLGDHAAPQGSILGGLLFIINENDFPACRLEGESVVFVDDDTDVVSDTDPKELLQKIQHEADLSCSWLKDNRMSVAGEKSKLLIVGTSELRKRKIGNQLHSIQVDGKRVEETNSEKLLGVIINNKMTWNEHLHGEDWRTKEENNQGLIPQLSKRLGILRKLSYHSSTKKLRMLASGLFYSKLSYCLPLYTATWGLDSYKVTNTRFSTYTKEDNRQLQVLQNQLCRLLLNERGLYYKQNLPTQQLLDKCGELSIHQLGAQRTLMMMKKMILSKKPQYITEKLHMKQTAGNSGSGPTITPVETTLTLKRSSFLYRAVKLFNQLPEVIREESRVSTFKTRLKTWIKEKISVKP